VLHAGKKRVNSSFQASKSLEATDARRANFGRYGRKALDRRVAQVAPGGG
jgi:hypothetical protein